MKSTLVLLSAFLFSFNVMAQSQIDAFIKEAQDFIVKKDYKQAQLSLQDAINNINVLLAEEVGKSLPAEVNGLKADGDADVSGGGMGMVGGGFTITKKYQNATNTNQNAEVQILGNSPLMTSMNMYLSNPAMMGSEYKSVRVGTQRAIMKSEMQDVYDDKGNSSKARSTEIQIPLNSTLITVRCNGFASEQAELDFANKLDLGKVKTTLGE